MVEGGTQPQRHGRLFAALRRARRARDAARAGDAFITSYLANSQAPCSPLLAQYHLQLCSCPQMSAQRASDLRRPPRGSLRGSCSCECPEPNTQLLLPALLAPCSTGTSQQACTADTVHLSGQGPTWAQTSQPATRLCHAQCPPKRRAFQPASVACHHVRSPLGTTIKQIVLYTSQTAPGRKARQ